MFTIIIGDCRYIFEGHLGVVRCLYIDDVKLISGGDQKKIIVWDYKVSYIS